jgi:hypothetical protein
MHVLVAAMLPVSTSRSFLLLASSVVGFGGFLFGYDM